ncbi:MAG: hypothetical protein K6A94_01030 [Bacteroidales bacterium]|nr:hypothetical protein [Bacteroidales bacterium]
MMYYELQELACAILGLNCDELINEDRENEIDESLYDKFEISMEQFENIVAALLPFTPVVKAGLSGKKYHAFVNEKEGLMLVKKEYKEKKGGKQ